MNKFEKEKYYIPSRLNRYINFNNKNIPIKEIISKVNCNIDKPFYKYDLNANINLNNLILVNKYYKLPANYEPNDLVDIDYKISIKGKIRKEVNKQYVKMVKDALQYNLHIINTSPYRSYKRQSIIYNNNVIDKGIEETDKTSARPGYSEHQTGLALDLRTIDKDIEEFENTEEFKWMQENAHLYGFILRYPKGKEDLTGYSYEPWHYRYIGITEAKYIKNNNITFDEYYAYFIEKEDK